MPFKPKTVKVPKAAPVKMPMLGSMGVGKPIVKAAPKKKGKSKDMC